MVCYQKTSSCLDTPLTYLNDFSFIVFGGQMPSGLGDLYCNVKILMWGFCDDRIMYWNSKIGPQNIH